MHPSAAPAALWDHIQEAAAFVRLPAVGNPKVGLVLGSGLGKFAEQIKVLHRIPFASIPHFPKAHVPGHKGEWVFAEVEGTPVVVMNGRVHAYEGYAMHEVTFGVRVMQALGVQTLVLTNAAGGANPNYFPGDLMVLADHINLTGMNPLFGPGDNRLGPRFPDMTSVYTPALRRALHQCGASLGVPLREGVYAGLSGPNYETPAEIRYLQRIGVDAVGMSTVAEAIAARHAGMRVAGISVISNHAAGITSQALSHEEVVDVGRQVEPQVLALLTAFIPKAAQLSVA